MEKVTPTKIIGHVMTVLDTTYLSMDDGRLYKLVQMNGTPMLVNLTAEELDEMALHILNEKGSK